MKRWAKGFVIALVFLFIASLVTFQSANVKADWSTYRSGIYRTGVGVGSPVLNTTVLWYSNISSPADIAGIKGDYDFGLRSCTTPIVSGGVVYISSESEVEISEYNHIHWGDVYALNASNGGVIWDYQQSNFVGMVCPTIANGVLFFGSGDYDGHGEFAALNATTGAMIWNNTAIEVYGSAPAVANGTVFLGGGFVYALNATNGNIIWKVSPPDRYGSANIVSSPAIANGVVYVGSGNSTYALNATTGNIIWSYKTDAVIFSDPCYVDGRLFVTSHDGNAYALNASSGSQIWNFSTTPPINTWSNGSNSEPSSPAVSDGLIYFSSNYLPPDQPWNNTFYALNATNGELIWSIPRITSLNDWWFWYGNPSAVNEVVYEKGGNGNNYLYALNATNGSIIWNDNETTIDTDPVVDNGILYFGSGGQVYALGTPSFSNLMPTPSNSLTLQNMVFLAIGILTTALVTLTLIYRRHRKTTKKPKA